MVLAAVRNLVKGNVFEQLACYLLLHSHLERPTSYYTQHGPISILEVTRAMNKSILSLVLYNIC